MVIGMGTVFAFLVLMVGCVDVVGRVIRRWEHLFPDEVPEPVKESPDRGAQLAIAIAAAAREAGR
jgi:sodium pump decarboxylase gamma subunit